MTSLLFIFVWFGVVLGATYLLLAHFRSTITIHILHFLHRCGWDRSEAHKELWDQFPEFEGIELKDKAGEVYHVEWQDWFILTFNDNWFQRMVADLITCPICMTFHLAFWLSTIGITALYFICPVSAWCFALIPLYTLSTPALILPLYHYVSERV